MKVLSMLLDPEPLLHPCLRPRLPRPLEARLLLRGMATIAPIDTDWKTRRLDRQTLRKCFSGCYTNAMLRASFCSTSSCSQLPPSILQIVLATTAHAWTRPWGSPFCY